MDLMKPIWEDNNRCFLVDPYNALHSCSRYRLMILEQGTFCHSSSLGMRNLSVDELHGCESTRKSDVLNLGEPIDME